MEAELDAVLAERDGYRAKVRELELDLCEATAERDKALWRLRRVMQSSPSKAAKVEGSPGTVQRQDAPVPVPAPERSRASSAEDPVLNDIGKLKDDLKEFKTSL